MDKTGVAHVLDQVASLLELKGDSPFRVRAFRSASRAVAGLPGLLDEALADGSLRATRGIGPAILAMVTDLATTGRSAAHEQLRAETPPGLVEMLAISGLGVTKARRIHQQLGIDSLAELEAAARDGRLAALPGFGKRSAENILRGLGFLHRASTIRLIHHAVQEATDLEAALGRIPGVLRVITAGDLRRRMEVVRDLVMVLVAETPPAEVFGRLAQVPGVDEFAGQDERRATLRLAGGTAVQVVVTSPANLGAVLVLATGNRNHVAQLAARAVTQGYALHGAGFWRGSAFVPTPDEDTLYRALGLPRIPPELREGAGELELVELPRLVQTSDLRGFLHCHTDFSDGSSSIEELARVARQAGYQYLGITDHSSSAAYAGGLRLEDLERQWAEVDRVNGIVDGIRVLKGVEVDILPDGRLDYGPAVLGQLDFVIASLHDDAGLSRVEMTDRVLRAMDNPYLTIWGHPTGRTLKGREPYPMDLEPLFARAAERGIAIEINADPHRMDLDWRYLRAARAAGAMISIGADAHSTAGLAHMEFGVGLARKGWLGPEAILNTRSLGEFLAFARARRPR
jgi:DNA polymerase (family 10)